MAFQRRTWLARIGTGLNKFIIGDKDANNKQTLTNSPDSVTQQGDVISADNLNDLEDRIGNQFDGLVLTKVWENPNPSQSMGGYPRPIANLGDVDDFVIEYRRKASISDTEFKHFHFRDFGINSVGYLEEISYSGDVVTLYSRGFSAEKVGSGGVYHTELSFDDCDYVDGSSTTTDNTRLIPYRIYAVGSNFYN